MILDRVEDLELRAFSAAPPSGEEPTLALRNVRRGFIQGLRAQPGTGTLCKLSGAQTARISATGNDFTEAASPFHLGPEVPPPRPQRASQHPAAFALDGRLGKHD